MAGSIFEMNPQQCPVCYVNHSPQTRCQYDLLVDIIKTMRREIAEVMKSNQAIPSMLKANKELFATAETFRQLVAQSAASLTMLEGIIRKRPEGEQIMVEFYAELENALNGTTKLSAEAPSGDGPQIQRPEGH